MSLISQSALSDTNALYFLGPRGPLVLPSVIEVASVLDRKGLARAIDTIVTGMPSVGLSVRPVLQ